VKLAALLILPVLVLAERCGEDEPKPDDTAPADDTGTVPIDTDKPHDTDTTPPTDTGPCQGTLTIADLQPGDLVISELMLRPQTYDETWLEITNTTDCMVDLDGLTIDWDMGGDTTIQRPVVVPPGGRATVAGSYDHDENGGFDPDYATGNLNLPHDDFSIFLQADWLPIDGITVHENTWFCDDFTGWSFTLDDRATDVHSNDDVDHWCMAQYPYGDGTYRGSPGEPNGTCTGTVADADADGHIRATIGGDDCDDGDSTSHPGASEICGDGADNDCDGSTDCVDSDCSTATGCEDCSNGSDDDGDGLVDCEDGDCVADFPCYEDCFNGSDDDLDGLADCADDDCWGGTCHPGGVKARVLSGGFQRQRYSRHSFGERLYHGAICRSFDGQRTSSITTLESVQGTVQVLPKGMSDWDATSARSTCTWSVQLAYLSEEKIETYRGVHWVKDLDRSDVHIGSGCRLYESWFLPDRLFRYGHDVYAGYAFTMAGRPFYATSPWYALQRRGFSNTSSNHWVSSSICDSDYHRYETTNSSGTLGSSLAPLLVVP
jgi:hypothetical protein